MAIVDVIHRTTGETSRMTERRLAAVSDEWRALTDDELAVRRMSSKAKRDLGIADPAADSTSSPDTAERPAGNAARDAWATYAASIGVTVTDAMSRDDIRTACGDVAPPPSS